MDINEFRNKYKVQGMDEAIIRTENQGLDYIVEKAVKQSAAQRAQADRDNMNKGYVHPLVDKLRNNDNKSR